jgi:hypothetical protein
MILFIDLIHNRSYALFLFIAVCILLNLAKDLAIWLQIELVQDKLRYLAF